jgi:hypothetical protein
MPHVYGPPLLRYVLGALVAVSSGVQCVLYACGEVTLVQRFGCRSEVAW